MLEEINNYLSVDINESRIEIYFYLENDKVMQIGEKINEINEQAYMNSYNWEVLLNYYLSKYESDLLIDMDSDPEAGMYVTYYELTANNKIKASKLVEIIISLIEDEEQLYNFIYQYGHEIEWD